MDLSKLTDAQLEQLAASRGVKKPAGPDLSKYSDAQLTAMMHKSDPTTDLAPLKQAMDEPDRAVGPFVAHAANAATAGWGPTLWGIDNALGHLPATLAVAVAPKLLGKWGISPEDQKGIIQQYRDYRDSGSKYLEQSQKEHPWAAGLGSATGGGALVVIPGGAEEAAGKSFLQGLGSAVKGGVAYGATAGLGSSKADLTKGSKQDAVQAFYDMLKGGAEGGAIGAGAATLSAPIMGAAEKLEDLGKAMFFRTAVGRSKTAFRQMKGKGLMDQAGEYLDQLGIGPGDTTGSIADKLRNRQSDLGDSLGGMLKNLDESGARIPAENVARRIEEKASGLNTTAQRGAYKQMMDEANAVRARGQDFSFDDAWAERHGAQMEANWNKQNDEGRSAMMKDISRAWNDEIDEQAAPLLQQSGQAGDAYRKLRQEYGLVSELGGHTVDNLTNQQAHHNPGLLDLGIGGAIGAGVHAVTHDPYLATGAAVLSHFARKYEGAALGRTAINMSRLAPESPAIPDFLRGAALSPLSEQDQK